MLHQVNGFQTELWYPSKFSPDADKIRGCEKFHSPGLKKGKISDNYLNVFQISSSSSSTHE
jgi:hypothetical protein